MRPRPRTQDLLLSLVLASASITRPEPGICLSSAGGGDVCSVLASLSSFTDCLKLRIAAPMSPPMLRSFLVPKIMITTARTISQCQMLNEPIPQSPRPDFYMWYVDD